MNKKIKLFSSAILCGVLITGCSKTMDCDIDGEHTHVYVNKEQIKKFFDGEYETNRDYHWTEETVPTTDEVKAIIDNDLCLVKDNIEYITQQIETHSPKREEYVYDYIYGIYYGYGYCYHYNPTTSEYEYGWGLGTVTGYHWEYRWRNIELEQYTENLVRDITYEIKLYKLGHDGKATAQTFASLEEVTPEYQYFKPHGVIRENTSSPYSLSNTEKDKTYHR